MAPLIKAESLPEFFRVKYGFLWQVENEQIFTCTRRASRDLRQERSRPYFRLVFTEWLRNIVVKTLPKRIADLFLANWHWRARREKLQYTCTWKYETFVTNKFANHGKRDQSSAPVRDPQSRKEPDPCNVSWGRRGDHWCPQSGKSCRRDCSSKPFATPGDAAWFFCTCQLYQSPSSDLRTNCLPGGAEVGRGGWKDIGCEGEVIAIGSPWPGLLQMGFDAPLELGLGWPPTPWLPGRAGFPLVFQFITSHTFGSSKFFYSVFCRPLSPSSSWSAPGSFKPTASSINNDNII